MIIIGKMWLIHIWQDYLIVDCNGFGDGGGGGGAASVTQHMTLQWQTC